MFILLLSIVLSKINVWCDNRVSACIVYIVVMPGTFHLLSTNMCHWIRRFREIEHLLGSASLATAFVKLWTSHGGSLCVQNVIIKYCTECDSKVLYSWHSSCVCLENTIYLLEPEKGCTSSDLVLGFNKNDIIVCHSALQLAHSSFSWFLTHLPIKRIYIYINKSPILPQVTNHS